ncbi:hypothetical protein YH66_05245 [[Brevibacterium] flavum]|uniref:Scaffolding protein n=1 Tax=[Brevibacterium] flavum TaxID=92706 RepID=A0A0F6Z5B2_9CORY|nr:MULTISPECIES: hypothetical protein [Corynebacterium]AKF27003.1 hypothetical protein YH66_05245 [[Brevibacterium] flavum]ANE07825.1 hypothetical protein A3654_05235 [Corynebacterium glutamicum]AST20241.1 hypothetical protein CEY17_05300 [Corynebacterium glutamicum ATCC 14067]KEI22716.1 hypothetical protein KIQ_009085 [Corynebacterium glutamicum ATCC 14067]KIH74259.1 hypothetical protein SD36_05270 [Corynebacterium glutamicum]
MSAIAIKFAQGPITYEAEEAVVGGQVVEAGSTPRSIKPAGAASETIVGVAIIDAVPKTAPYTGKPTHASVAITPAQVPVTSDGTAGVGDLVIAAADGAVTAAAGTEPPAQIVGRVIEVLADNIVSVRLYV